VSSRTRSACSLTACVMRARERNAYTFLFTHVECAHGTLLHVTRLRDRLASLASCHADTTRYSVTSTHTVRKGLMHTSTNAHARVGVETTAAGGGALVPVLCAFNVFIDVLLPSSICVACTHMIHHDRHRDHSRTVGFFSSSFSTMRCSSSVMPYTSARSPLLQHRSQSYIATHLHAQGQTHRHRRAASRTVTPILAS
jgi:hypothetical protein